MSMCSMRSISLDTSGSGGSSRSISGTSVGGNFNSSPRTMPRSLSFPLRTISRICSSFACSSARAFLKVALGERSLEDRLGFRVPVIARLAHAASQRRVEIGLHALTHDAPENVRLKGRQRVDLGLVHAMLRTPSSQFGFLQGSRRQAQFFDLFDGETWRDDAEAQFCLSPASWLGPASIELIGPASPGLARSALIRSIGSIGIGPHVAGIMPTIDDAACPCKIMDPWRWRPTSKRALMLSVRCLE
jgi:hypothetical protein